MRFNPRQGRYFWDYKFVVTHGILLMNTRRGSNLLRCVEQKPLSLLLNCLATGELRDGGFAVGSISELPTKSIITYLCSNCKRRFDPSYCAIQRFQMFTFPYTS